MLSDQAFSASSAFSVNTGFGPNIAASAELSLTPKTDLELDYTCADSQIQINGPFSVSGLAQAIVAGVSLNLDVIASGTASATFNLQASPTGGLWLTK